MKHLKSHPIYESLANAKSISDLAEATEAGRDLKAICSLTPKNSGRVYIQPIGLPGSKTYIEKNKDSGLYTFSALSNGVPFYGEAYSTAEEAFRMLWSYVISKNLPVGMQKKNFRAWANNPLNSVHGKALPAEKIISLFVEETGDPEMVKSAYEYFAEPGIKNQLEKAGFRIIPNPKGFRLSYGPNVITKVLGDFIEHYSTAGFILNPSKQVFKRTGAAPHFMVGSKIKNIREAEMKILGALKEVTETSLNMIQTSRAYSSPISQDKRDELSSIRLGLKIAVNALSKIISGEESFDLGNEFDALVGLSAGDMSVIRRESPDFLWPEILKRTDHEIANVSSDLGDLGF